MHEWTSQGLSSLNTYIAGLKFLKFSNDENLKVLSSVRIMNLCWMNIKTKTNKFMNFLKQCEKQCARWGMLSQMMVDKEQLGLHAASHTCTWAPIVKLDHIQCSIFHRVQFFNKSQSWCLAITFKTQNGGRRESQKSSCVSTYSPYLHILLIIRILILY